MIKTSEVADGIQLSLVRALFNEAKNYDDVVDFTLGDPDIQPDQAIKDAACVAIQLGKTRYSQNAGLLELREVISEAYHKKEGLKYSAEGEIIVTVGAMEGLYLLLLSILDEGDEVLIPAPYYVNYVQMVKMCHGIPVIIDNPYSDDLTFRVEDIKKAITPRTKAIMINTPSNPTGKVLSQATLEGIAKLAVENDLAVISDEVYKCLIYKDIKWSSIAHFPGMRERTFLVNSLSKEFCMTGYRLGYVLGPENVIMSMIKLQENVAACAPLPSQYAAITALGSTGDYSSRMKSIYTERMNYVVSRVNSIKGLKCDAPDATFYLMIDISSTGMNSFDFAMSFLKHSHVAVVPGRTYGNCCDKYVRLAFTKDIPVLKEGLDRMEKFMKSLQNE